MAFLDLRKVFDSLDHHILLSQLHGLEVCGGALNWFTNYLTNRYQRVKLNFIIPILHGDWLEVAYLTFSCVCK